MAVNYSNIDRALVAAERTDSVNLGLNSVAVAQKDPSVSAFVMSELEIIKHCFLVIRRTEYLEADLARNVKRIGYYNIEEYMNLVCKNLNNYISRSFGVEIFYEANIEDCINMSFDGRIVEKCILDSVYNLISAGMGKAKRITIYMEYTEKFMQFCIKSGFCAKTQNHSLAEVALLYPEVAERLSNTSYADLAAQQIGGYAKYKYLKNVTRVEIYIPKNLRATENLMNECETKICKGEAVMVYETLSEKYINSFFADLKYKLI